MSNNIKAPKQYWAISWPPPGRTHGHQWAGLLAAGGQISVALDTGVNSCYHRCYRDGYRTSYRIAIALSTCRRSVDLFIPGQPT